AMPGFTSPYFAIIALTASPAGTALGSSGSFSTALLKALYAHRRRLLQSHEIAERACEIEMDRLGEPIGKQDQYAAAFGGVTCFSFNPDDSVNACPLKVKMDGLFELEDNLLLFFTGFSRGAGSILLDQKHRTEQADPAMLQNLH